jgi:hypothetical protein
MLDRDVAALPARAQPKYVEHTFARLRDAATSNWHYIVLTCMCFTVAAIFADNVRSIVNYSVGDVDDLASPHKQTLEKVLLRVLITLFIVAVFVVYATLVTFHGAAYGKHATQAFEAICSNVNVQLSRQQRYRLQVTSGDDDTV